MNKNSIILVAQQLRNIMAVVYCHSFGPRKYIREQFFNILLLKLELGVSKYTDQLGYGFPADDGNNVSALPCGA